MEIKMSKVIQDLVKEYPNDYDLGGKVRELVNRLNQIKTNKKIGKQEKDGK